MMASKRGERRRACTGKRRYSTAAAAAAARHALAVVKPDLTYYECRFCNGWHLGHPPARIRRALGARKREWIPPRLTELPPAPPRSGYGERE